MGPLYLIRRGEKARPMCVGCKKAGDEGVVVTAGRVHICKACKGKLNRGEGLYVDQEYVKRWAM